jgi:hypothetical protein
MRTNIDIDDELMAVAMAAGPFKTKREAVESGLRLLARQKAYQSILDLRGKVNWVAPDEPWPVTVNESRATYAAVRKPKTEGAKRAAR